MPRPVIPRAPIEPYRRDPLAWEWFVRDAFREHPSRYHHARGVWHRAATAARREAAHLGEERALRLELAALLHDIGRAFDPLDREPHAFVGGRFLDDLGLGDVAVLVAHHSGAQHEAAARGFQHLDRWRTDDEDLQAVLTYLDRTTSPRGEPVTLSWRRDDLAARYGADSLQVANFDASLPRARHGERLLGHRRHHRPSAGGRRLTHPAGAPPSPRLA